MQFKTMYDRVPVVANSGDREKQLFRAQLDEHGHIELVEDGKEDMYAFIQSHKDSCDIKLILDRFASGDTTVLSQRQGTYTDLTEMPKTFAEMLQTVIAGEQHFNSLPLEIRAKFGHSFHNWMASMDKPDFAEKMGFMRGNAEHVVEDVVVSPVVIPSDGLSET